VFVVTPFEMLTNLDNKKPERLYSQSFEGDQVLERACRDLLQFVVLQKPAVGHVRISISLCGNSFLRTPLAGKMNDNNKHEGTIKMQITFCPKEIRTQPHVRLSDRAKGVIFSSGKPITGNLHTLIIKVFKRVCQTL
jgi:hypothetical protein